MKYKHGACIVSARGKTRRKGEGPGHADASRHHTSSGSHLCALSLSPHSRPHYLTHPLFMHSVGGLVRVPRSAFPISFFSFRFLFHHIQSFLIPAGGGRVMFLTLSPSRSNSKPREKGKHALCCLGGWQDTDKARGHTGRCEEGGGCVWAVLGSHKLSGPIKSRTRLLHPLLWSSSLLPGLPPPAGGPQSHTTVPQR